MCRGSKGPLQGDASLCPEALREQLAACEPGAGRQLYVLVQCSSFRSCSTLYFYCSPAFKIFQCCFHDTTEQNEIHASRSSCVSGSLSVCHLYLLPPPHPANSSPPASLLFSSTTRVIPESELLNSSLSQNPICFLCSTYHNLESRILTYWLTSTYSYGKVLNVV